MFAGLISIAGGILAASALIIARKPNAKELINKLTPYQGWIGIVLFFWGAWGVLGCVRHMGLVSAMPLVWLFWLATSAADLIVGFLLGFGLISKYSLGSSVVAQARGEQLRLRLAPYQGISGLFAIVMGVLYILFTTVL